MGPASERALEKESPSLKRSFWWERERETLSCQEACRTAGLLSPGKPGSQAGYLLPKRMPRSGTVFLKTEHLSQQVFRIGNSECCLNCLYCCGKLLNRNAGSPCTYFTGHMLHQTKQWHSFHMGLARDMIL